MLLSLFDLPPVPGFATRDELISPRVEAALIAAIDASDLAPFQFQQWQGKRMTASFGLGYSFTTQRMERGRPIPAVLLPVRERMAGFAGVAADDFVQALLIRYDPGAGIGWHRDRPQYEHVAGLSLGAPATLRLRRRRADGGFDRASAALDPRAAYRLSGEVRHDWEHSIAPIDRPRWSITFRTLSALGAQAAGI